MNIITSCNRVYGGYNKINVSSKAGNPIFSINEIDMAELHKEGSDLEKIKKRYFVKIIKSMVKFKTFWMDIFDKEYIVITCDCDPSATICHRHFLAEFLNTDDNYIGELGKDMPATEYLEQKYKDK